MLKLTEKRLLYTLSASECLSSYLTEGSAFNMCLVEKLARLASANQVALFETFIFYGISV